MDLRSLEGAGDLWRVSRILGASKDESIVIPRSALAGPVNINNQTTVTRRDGITILGFAINAHGANGTVTLRSSDPAWFEGRVTDHDIYVLHIAGSATITQTVDNCVIPLSPASYQPTPSDGATLELITNASVTAGHIVIWGIHGQLDIGGRRSFTGSPADYQTEF